MRRHLVLWWAVVLFVGVLAVPAGAGDKLGVTFETQQDLSSPDGTFTVAGDAAAYLCESGTLTSENATIIWLSEDMFKIWIDKILTCANGEEFVLELTNTIVLGQGGIPGKGTWRLRVSTGLNPAPMGAGDIVMGEDGEDYVGWLKFK